MAKQAQVLKEQRASRSSLACENCRQKKLRCSNGRPRCQHCDDRGKECVYIQKRKAPRPSNARIARLEEENRRLRALVPSTHSQSKEPVIAEEDNQCNSTAFSMNQGAKKWTNPSQKDTSRPHVDICFESVLGEEVDTDSRSHGPTSAVADDIASSHAMRQRGSCSKNKHEDIMRNQLLAEAAKQRQFEKINLDGKKFDFDGVDPELAMQLLSLYWDRQLDIGAIVYRPAFTRDLACNGPYFSKLLLNAIYFTASKYTSRTEVRDDASKPLTAGRPFRRRLTELLQSALLKSRIPTIQALLLFSSSLFTWCDERSLSWLYSGLAFNMIIDLGIHIDIGTNSTSQPVLPEVAEIRQRLFWGAFVIDKLQSLYQGRPVRLRETDTTMALKFLDEYEELDQLDPSSYGISPGNSSSPTRCISTLHEYCTLSSIMSRILTTLYSEGSTRSDPACLLSASKCLQGELESWYQGLPPRYTTSLAEADGGITLPHVLALMAMYHTLTILLHRPFVSDGHLRCTTPSIATTAFNNCVAAALDITNILRVYEKTYSIKTAPYIISYATYVSATIHVRIAAQRPGGSEAHTALVTCLRVLEIHEKLYLGPKRALRVVHGLMGLMSVNVEPNARPDSTEGADLDNQLTARSWDISSVSSVRRPNTLPTEQEVSFEWNSLNNLEPTLSDYMSIDMDAVIQSFDVHQMMDFQSLQPTSWANTVHSPTSSIFAQDTLAGGSTLDPLFGLDNFYGDFGG